MYTPGVEIFELPSLSSFDINHVYIGFQSPGVSVNFVDSQFLRLHIDIAFYATCCCIVGLAVERYILICRYSDAKILLTKSVRVLFLFVSLILTALPVVMKFFDDGDEAWLSQVKLFTPHHWEHFC